MSGDAAGAGRCMPGSAAALFYDAAPPCASEAAAAETAALLAHAKMPEGAFSTAHFHAAVAWHKQGRISDPELAAVGLLVHLQHDLKTRQSRHLIQRVGPNDIAAMFRRYPEDRLPPLLRLLGSHRLRTIKGMAREALLGWACGFHQGILAMGTVTTLELLAAQARGRRHVGIGLPVGEFLELDESYPGGFIHHDLCHLAKFHGEAAAPANYHGQVGFFAAVERLVVDEPELLRENSGLPAGLDLVPVIADMNGDARFLVTLFLYRLIGQRQLVAPAAITALVEEYLVKFGMAPPKAAQLAPLFGTQRLFFLEEVGAYFEGYGAQVMAGATGIAK